MREETFLREEKMNKTGNYFLREEREINKKVRYFGARNERGSLFEKVRKDKKNSYLILLRGTGEMRKSIRNETRKQNTRKKREKLRKKEEKKRKREADEDFFEER